VVGAEEHLVLALVGVSEGEDRTEVGMNRRSVVDLQSLKVLFPLDWLGSVTRNPMWSNPVRIASNGSALLLACCWNSTRVEVGACNKTMPNQSSPETRAFSSNPITSCHQVAHASASRAENEM
jgi:hypothetical protein